MGTVDALLAKRVKRGYREPQRVPERFQGVPG